LGGGAEAFYTLHEDKISAIQRKMVEYVTDLQRVKRWKAQAPGTMPAGVAEVMPAAMPIMMPEPTPSVIPDSMLMPNSAPVIMPGPAPGVTPAAMSIDITPKGFPVLPDASFENFKKENLEDLMRNYLNIHYSISLQSFIKYQTLTF
jgi:hypothetical protein